MLTNLILQLGLTRDSLVWFWGRLVTASTILAAAGPFDLMDPYLSDDAQKWVVLVAVIILWLAGRYDSSPLPGRRS
jgi:hypothetical protein